MFDLDAGKERLSILSKYVRLPRSAEHGEVTASLLYERLVMAAIAASKTEEDMDRIFSFSWDNVRYLTNKNLTNDDFAKLTLTIFDRRPIPCLFVQQKTGDWFEMPMICAIECGEDAGVHFRLNEFFIKTCNPGGRRRAASAASLNGVSVSHRLHTLLTGALEAGEMVISSERLREVLHLGQKEPVAYPEKYSRYKDLFRKVIRPCCLELTGMTDICVKSVEPIGGNWEKAPSLKVATKFVVERQPVSLRIPKLCIGEITPCDDAAMGTAYQQVEICA